MEDLCRDIQMTITPPPDPTYYKVEEVDSLPPTGEENTIYLMDGIGYTYNDGWTPEVVDDKEYC